MLDLSNSDDLPGCRLKIELSASNLRPLTLIVMKSPLQFFLKVTRGRMVLRSLGCDDKTDGFPPSPLIPFTDMVVTCKYRQTQQSYCKCLSSKYRFHWPAYAKIPIHAMYSYGLGLFFIMATKL